jgi:hypothetical protein
MQRPEDPAGAPSPNTKTINEPLVPFTTAGSFVWVHALSVGWPGSPGSDGASPYHTSSLHPSESEMRLREDSVRETLQGIAEVLVCRYLHLGAIVNVRQNIQSNIFAGVGNHSDNQAHLLCRKKVHYRANV